MPAVVIVESHVPRAHARGCSRLRNSAQQEDKSACLNRRIDARRHFPAPWACRSHSFFSIRPFTADLQDGPPVADNRVVDNLQGAGVHAAAKTLLYFDLRSRQTATKYGYISQNASRCFVSSPWIAFLLLRKNCERYVNHRSPEAETPTSECLPAERSASASIHRAARPEHHARAATAN
jgi:hypothetical protein